MAKSKRSWLSTNDEKKKKISEQLKEKMSEEEFDSELVSGGRGLTAQTHWPTTQRK